MELLTLSTTVSSEGLMELAQGILELTFTCK